MYQDLEAVPGDYATPDEMPEWVRRCLDRNLPNGATYMSGHMAIRRHKRHYGERIDRYLVFHYELGGKAYKAAIRAEVPRNLHKIRPY